MSHDNEDIYISHKNQTGTLHIQLLCIIYTIGIMNITDLYYKSLVPDVPESK
jgi:hypothetical protein